MKLGDEDGTSFCCWPKLKEEGFNVYQTQLFSLPSDYGSEEGGDE